MTIVPALLRRKLTLGAAIVLCVIGVVVIASALIGSEPGPGDTAHANTRLIVIGLAIAAAGGVLIGLVTFTRRR
jgi:hypothetical protein